MIGEECKFLHLTPCRKYMKNLERCCRPQCKGYHPELCKYSRATKECYNDRCFRIHLKGTRRKQTPPAIKEPSTTPRTTNQQQAMIKTQKMAYNRPPPSIPPPLTLPPHQLITPPHSLRNISPPIRLPFHCTLILHHCMLSLIQPAHPQPLLTPFILLKHPHSHHKHIILLFPASSSHLNPTPHTSIPRMGTTERHKGAQLQMTIFFLWEVMHNVQRQLNNMMSVMSPTPASWGKPTYTQ